MTDDRRTPPTPPGDGPAPTSVSASDLDRFVADFGTTFLAATRRAGEGAQAGDGAVDGAGTALGVAEGPTDGTTPRGPAQRGQRRRSFSLRRGRVGLIGAATLTAVVVGVVVLPLTPAPKPFVKSLDPVAEARAALGERGEIVHYVTRTEREDRGFRPTEPSLCEALEREVWQAATDGPRWRTVQPGMDRKCGVMSRGDGTQLRGEEQFARTATESVEYYPELGRAFVTTGLPSTGPSSYGGLPMIAAPERYQGADLVSTLRRMLRDGYLRTAGYENRRGGRAAFRLIGETRTTTGSGAKKITTTTRLKYLVDPSTFAPIELESSSDSPFLRTRDGGKVESVSTTTFLTYETLPGTPENEKLLEIQPKGPFTTETTTAAQFEADAKARMKRENAEGRANALRTNAERKRREASKQP
ncbi:MAG: hypothetical protein Q7T55_14635 [Solirubrobacteraceae bacterium]|nr:hypothetical protein [Solirubrobacteraceae bacterium]